LILLPGEKPEDFTKPKSRKKGWMFWGCFAGGQKGPFIVWDKELKDQYSGKGGRGHINSAKYQDHVLPLLLDFHNQIPGSIVQQDNAPAHVSQSSMAWINSHFSPGTVAKFPARSPDLNPIENVWPWMKKWIEDNRPTATGKALIEAIKEAWAAVPLQMLQNCARSMKRRVNAVIIAGGDFIGN
jgi:hypothetical protein